MNKVFSFLFLSLLTLFFGFTAKAQLSDIPDIPDTMSETSPELKKMDKDIIRVSNWLETTVITTDTIRRKPANIFIITWLVKTDNLNLDAKAQVFTLFKENRDLLIVYLAGCARFCVEDKSKNELQANVAGVRSAIRCYNLGGNVKRTDDLLQVIEAEKQGKLEEFLKETIDN